MALISMRQMLDHAAEFGYGVPAFNVNNLEQMRAIMEAADKTDSPVIVQASAGARKYAGAPFLRHLMLAAIEEFPHIPVCMHQDHGTSPDVCQRSIQLGFSSVMMDGSLKADGKTPAALGQLIYFFEYACGLSGYLLGVNPFDQPGVEAYKKNMFALLGKPGYEQRRTELEAKLNR